MTFLQETCTLPQWVVDETDDLIVVLQNDLVGEQQLQMTPLGRKIPGIQVLPYKNKENDKYDHSNSVIDQMISSITQHDHQLYEQPDQQLSEPVNIVKSDQQLSEPERTDKPDQQLSEPERIERMNEEEVIDYLVDLMQEEPSDLKTKSHQLTNKENNKSDYVDPNTSQSSNLENSLFQNTLQFNDVNQIYETNSIQSNVLENCNLQNTIQYGDVKQLTNTSMQIYKNPSSTVFQNLVSNNAIMDNQILSFHHPSQVHQNNQNSRINQNRKVTVNQSLHQNEIIDRKIYENKNNEFHLKLNTKTMNQDNSKKVNLNNIHNRLNIKPVYIQNSTSSNSHKQIVNKTINHVQVAPVEKQVRTIDHKKILEIVKAQNRAYLSKKETSLVKESPLNQKHTLQNQIKMPIFNRERELSTTKSSKGDETKLDIENNNSEISTKKRKKYEEEPQGDEEEEKKIWQAKKAKNYREKKKEEFKRKDNQIKNLQEALQKSEREKIAYMNENNQLKEEIKKKDVLLQLYEIN